MHHFMIYRLYSGEWYVTTFVFTYNRNHNIRPITNNTCCEGAHAPLHAFSTLTLTQLINRIF